MVRHTTKEKIMLDRERNLPDLIIKTECDLSISKYLILLPDSVADQLNELYLDGTLDLILRDNYNVDINNAKSMVEGLYDSIQTMELKELYNENTGFYLYNELTLVSLNDIINDKRYKEKVTLLGVDDDSYYGDFNERTLVYFI